MKIIILTQEDTFTIPQNIESIIRLDFVQVAKIVNIDSTKSLSNQKTLFLKGFGVIQFLKLGAKIIYNKTSCALDSLFLHKFYSTPKSLYSVARRYRIDYKKIKNPNSSEFLKEMKSLDPDVIVSFSAPVVFKSELLSIPKYGCINLHCSLLPNFAGVMPSFWTLYKQQQSTGVTVHFMDDKIDNGLILDQKKVVIEKNETIFSLILKTKKIGGELMCKVLEDIHNSRIKLRENSSHKGSYFGWPSLEDFKKFKKNGGKLI